jgi:hypothetical protein
MRVKSLCLVCRGAKTRLGEPCLGCKGHGFVYVNYVETKRPDPVVEVEEPVIHIKPKKVKLISEPPKLTYKPFRAVRRSKSQGLTEKIVAAVAKYQRAYLESLDIMQLRPMVLRDIARVVGCDEVTVHQHLRDQEIQGVDARWLFSEAVGGISNKVIMAVLKDLMQIKATDAGYCKMLADRGITIARRTVTKYRLKIIRG